MTSRPTILCSGIAVQDFVMRVERFPQPGEKVPASEFVTIGGGCSANSAVAIARLGGRAMFAGPVGDARDAASNQILAGLAAEGVDHSHVVRVDGGTASVSLIMLDGTGEKMISTRPGDRLRSVGPRDAGAAISGVDVLLVDNRVPGFVTPLCEAARAANIPVVMDFDKKTTGNDPLIAMGTHVIASAEALCSTTGVRDPREALRAYALPAAKLFAVTDGPNGCYWLEQDNVRHLPAFKIDAVDTLGAGDTFHGAFALALAEGRQTADAFRFASAAAAIKCTAFGGMNGAPSRAEVDAFLRAS